ncbi:MAG: dienelactone hydrolase family protein [Kofleriaceae bacterium]|nr:dienelactone hydrolase family protein [Kofleriaceae bacterium]
MGIEGYLEYNFSYQGVSHPVYRRGQGPGVLIMHELYGLSPEVVRFADWIAEAGFTVFVPCLFGGAGDQYSQTKGVLSASMACVRKSFSLLAKGQSSPITDWLRALGRSAFDELPGLGVGAIGMCLTGNFALTLMVDEHLLAPVLSQPSLPLSIGQSRKESLHISEENLRIVKKRIDEQGLKVLGLRFSEDWLCPKERFVTLRRRLGSGFEGIEIDSSPGNVHGIDSKAHSVLTADLVDCDGHPTLQARDRVIAFLKERLL